MNRNLFLGPLAGTLLWMSASCSLVDSNGVHLSYSFDAQHFTGKLSDDGAQPYTVPEVACAEGATPDPCAEAQANLPAEYAQSSQVTCDASAGHCVASAEVRLPQLIDLRTATTQLPSEAVQFGIDTVAIDRIAYWVAKSSLNVATPPIEVYVAPQSAKDEHDPSAVLLGTVASLPAGSSDCADPVDSRGDSAAAGARVCDIPFTQAGAAALAGYVKSYQKAPFQIIVTATVTAHGGEPLPAGALDFYVRPSVTLSVLK